MGDERVFTPEELEAMGVRTVDLLLSAIDAGDQEGARKLSQRMHIEFLAMHDLYRDWIAHLLTIIGRRLGDEALYEALKETVGGYTRRLGSRYRAKSMRRRVEMLAAGLRGHLHPFKMEEDDEKFTITPEVCPSGGRLIRDGAYGPPRDFLKIEKPQPMTFERADFPVYCAHCYVQNIIPTEPGGPPLIVTEPSGEPGVEPCRAYVYKGKADPGSS